ncbi:MAG: response regulator transcription factor [Gemmatimonadota bacterium]|nr:response regulator transcription factor [Gemmatimonadota bacterium]
MSAAPVRVLVVDDHAVVREGLRHVLGAADGFVVVGEAGTGVEALALAAEHQPDVVLLDLSMPGMSGLEVTAALRARWPAMRVLVLSMHEQDEYVIAAVRGGAHGYVLKDTAPAELRAAIRAVHAGAGFFSPAVASRLGAAVRGEVPADAPSERLARLTPREREVLLFVATGLTNREIAGRLGISPRTVESHRESLMKKLSLRSVAELTRFALQVGLITS